MNYLGNAADRVMGRVGFRNNTPTRRASQGHGGDDVDDHNNDEYSYVSGLSAPGTTNLLATRTGANQGGERRHPGQLQRGGQTPDGDKGKSPTRSTQTTMPTSKATSREWGGEATKAPPSMEGSPKTNQHRGHARDWGEASSRTSGQSKIGRRTRS